jgi:phosphatidylglycerol:prolipoprotein diacylglycerol transferase
MQPNPVLLRIGPIAIHWYGVLIVTGAMLAAYLTSKLSSRNGHDPEISWNLLLACLVAGVIGARLYHVISGSNWQYYRAHPGEIFGLQMSGFGIYGAVLGGVVGLWIFTRFSKLRFLEWADYAAPGLILAQAIGRWGNFFNQELYGPPTDLPWGVYIAPEYRLPGLEAFDRFHPTFLYESVLCFAGFLALYYLARHWANGRLYGDIFFLYCLIYPVIRFFTEFLRPDAWKIGDIPAAQWISLGSIALFAVLLITRHRLRRPSMIYVLGTPWQPPKKEEEAEKAPETEAQPLPAEPQDASTPVQAEPQEHEGKDT